MNSFKTLTQVITLIAIAIGLVLMGMTVHALNTAPANNPAMGGNIISSPANELLGTPQTQVVSASDVHYVIVDNPPVLRNPTAEAATLVAEMTRVADINPNEIRTGIDWEFTPGFDPEWAALLARDQVPERVYGILQFQYPIDFGYPEKRNTLEAMGVEFYLEAIATGDVWYVIIPGTALAELHQWVAQGELRHVGSIPPLARIHPDVWAMAEVTPKEPIPITATLFEAPPRQQLAFFYTSAEFFAPQITDTWAMGWVFADELLAFAELPQILALRLRNPELCVNEICSIEPTPSR